MTVALLSLRSNIIYRDIKIAILWESPDLGRNKLALGVSARMLSVGRKAKSPEKQAAVYHTQIWSCEPGLVLVRVLWRHRTDKMNLSIEGKGIC